MGTHPDRWIRVGMWAACILVAIYSVIALARIVSSTAPDFSVYYDAAAALGRGESIYQQRDMYTGVGYPPVSMLLYLPFTCLPYTVAQAFWVIGSFLLIGYCAFLSVRLTGKSASGYLPVVWAGALCSFPFRFTLGMGQSNIVALALLLLLIHRMRRSASHWLPTALVYALVVLVKPQLVVFAPLFLLFGKWKELTATGIVLLLVGIVFGMVFGWDMYGEYITANVGNLMTFASPEVYYNQGLAATLSRVMPFSPLVKPLWISASLLLYFLTIVFIVRHRVSVVRAWVLLLPVYLLIEPLSWQHHYVFLLPAFVMAAAGSQSIGSWILIGLTGLLVGINITNPSAFLSDGRVLLLSHAGIGAFVFWIYLLYSGRKAKI